MEQRWIPVAERLPEDGTYLTTLDGELVGQEEPFTGMCGIENGKWDEYETPTELTADREWKLKVIIPCHQKWRNRSATELLFCMLRSGK